MDRARRAGFTALIVIVMVVTAPASDGSAALAGRSAWPTSTLVVSEVQTGGASASDEFVEIANQGSAPVDLLGLEVVYVTSSGSTVTRKATWTTSTVLGPGRRFLLGNGSGAFGADRRCDVFGWVRRDRGAIALRVVGGAVDRCGRLGRRTNAFVEGTAAPAPSAGSSLERMPGGAAGNATDTNDNVPDWFVQAVPSPQGSARRRPGSGASPTPVPTPTAAPPTPTPTRDADLARPRHRPARSRRNFATSTTP